MIACKQINKLDHYILPTFSKTDLSKLFNVKRITCFSLDFNVFEKQENIPSQIIELRDRLKKELEIFNNYKSTPPNLKNYRYADDSMFGKVDNFQFRDCLINKISFVRN